jgi:RNA polymerase sigma factor (sigma-70 family)
MQRRQELTGLVPAGEAPMETRRLFDQHGRTVFALCLLLLRDRQEAEDAAQQTFLSAHQSLLSGREPRHPAAWLATIARNECRRRLSKRAAAPLPLDGNENGTLPDPADLAGERTDLDELRTAIAALPPRQRMTLVLRDFYGLSYREIAAALGLPTAAVDGSLYRARSRLRERLRRVPRAAAALTVPASLRDTLAAALPGFEQDGTPIAAGGGAGVLAKLVSLPLGAKLTLAAAGATAVGASVGPRLANHQVVRTPAPARAAVAVGHRDGAATQERRARDDRSDTPHRRTHQGHQSAERAVRREARGVRRTKGGRGPSESTGEESSESPPSPASAERGTSGTGNDSSGSGSAPSSSGSGTSDTLSSGSGSSGSGSSGGGSSASGSSGSGSSGSGSSGSGSSGSNSSGSGGDIPDDPTTTSPAG